MAAKKKRAVKKLATADLRAATLASVKAALGKVPGGGIINGFVLSEAALEKLGVSANALAKKIAASTSEASGFSLEPAVIKRPGTILVGYLPPAKILR
ncbi:MAG TPA: hypothetical protein VGJ91_08215 [Polyangiaceae bacterium]|jgi:hypothetical protein